MENCPNHFQNRFTQARQSTAMDKEAAASGPWPGAPVPLNGRNYASWAARVQQQLESEHVWDVVKDDPGRLDSSASSVDRRARRKKIDQANAIIVNALETHVLRRALQGASSWNLWKLLGDLYHQGQYGELADTAFEYMESKLDARQSMWEHLAHMEHLVQALASKGLVIPEELQILFLLHSVKAQSRSTIQELRQRDTPPSKEQVLMELMRSSAACSEASTETAMSSATSTTTLQRSTLASSLASLPQPSSADVKVNAFGFQPEQQSCCPTCMQPRNGVGPTSTKATRDSDHSMSSGSASAYTTTWKWPELDHALSNVR